MGVAAKPTDTGFERITQVNLAINKCTHRALNHSIKTLHEYFDVEAESYKVQKTLGMLHNFTLELGWVEICRHGASFWGDKFNPPEQFGELAAETSAMHEALIATKHLGASAILTTNRRNQMKTDPGGPSCFSDLLKQVSDMKNIVKNLKGNPGDQLRNMVNDYASKGQHDELGKPVAKSKQIEWQQTVKEAINGLQNIINERSDEEIAKHTGVHRKKMLQEEFNMRQLAPFLSEGTGFVDRPIQIMNGFMTNEAAQAFREIINAAVPVKVKK